MVVTDWLIDKSALWKLPRSPDYPEWLNRMNRAQVWASLPTRLEVAVSARDPQHWPMLRQDLLAPLLEANATPRSESIAIEIMESLMATRLHRTVSVPDVMIAAIAVADRFTLLHDDADFDRIYEAYGGPVVERLSL